MRLTITQVHELIYRHEGFELASAKWQSRKMREQGLLRCITYREAVALFARGYYVKPKFGKGVFEP